VAQFESHTCATWQNELNPEGIKADLKALDDRKQESGRSGAASLWPWYVGAALESAARPGEEQINQVLNQVDQAWNGIRHAPQTVADKAKEQYDSVTTTISDYLRNTGKKELVEGIQRIWPGCLKARKSQCAATSTGSGDRHFG